MTRTRTRTRKVEVVGKVEYRIEEKRWKRKRKDRMRLTEYDKRSAALPYIPAYITSLDLSNHWWFCSPVT